MQVLCFSSHLRRLISLSCVSRLDCSISTAQGGAHRARICALLQMPRTRIPTWRMELDCDDLTSLAAMLPSACHTDTEAAVQCTAMLPFPSSVTASVMLRVYRPI